MLLSPSDDSEMRAASESRLLEKMRFHRISAIAAFNSILRFRSGLGIQGFLFCLADRILQFHGWNARNPQPDFRNPSALRQASSTGASDRADDNAGECAAPVFRLLNPGSASQSG